MAYPLSLIAPKWSKVTVIATLQLEEIVTKWAEDPRSPVLMRQLLFVVFSLLKRREAWDELIAALSGQLLPKLLIRLPRGGFRLTDLGVIHDENVICKIP